jgi:hypothetical protein
VSVLLIPPLAGAAGIGRVFFPLVIAQAAEIDRGDYAAQTSVSRPHVIVPVVQQLLAEME